MDSCFPTLAPVHVSHDWHRYTFPLAWHRLLISYSWQPRLPPVTHFLRLAPIPISRACTDTYLPQLAPITHFFPLAAALATGYTFPALTPIHISRAWHQLLISYSWQPHLAPVAHFQRFHCFSYDHPVLCTG